MHHFFYNFVIYLILCISHLYWQLQNVIVNKFNSVTYSVYTYMYVCMYLTVTIKFHSTPVTQFYWYSTVTSDYCGAVLFFIPLTNLIASTNQLTFLIHSFLKTLFNSKCVCGGKESAFVVCVMSAVLIRSKNCLEW
jgi:hypothetical protein